MSISRKRVNPSRVRRAIDLAENGQRPPAIISLEKEIINLERDVGSQPTAEDIRRIAQLKLRLDALTEEWRTNQSTNKLSGGTSG